jgi:hypothetical protein
MSLRAKVVASIAVASSAFLLAPAAQAATHPVQVNGGKLLSALLPASAFGSGWEMELKLWSRGIWHFKATDHVSTMSCAKLELSTVLLRVGESGVATSWNGNADWVSSFPSVELTWYQTVYQFPSTKAASAFYNQAKARYAACRDFKINSLPGDPVPGGGVEEIVNQTMTHHKVGSYQAFQTGQLDSFSDDPGFALDLNTTVALAGTNVYFVENFSGTNDPVSNSMMTKLINRVKKLR